jgi:hypothetical protein
MSLRTLGTVLAIIASVTVVALLTWSFVSYRSGAGSEPAKEVRIAPMPPLSVDLSVPDPNSFENILTGEGEGRVVLLDADDNVESEYEYEDLENLGAGRHRVIKPRAWMYLDDGSVVHLRAAQAEFTQPAGSREPESGLLTGGVTIEVFDAGAGKAPTSAPTDPGTESTVPSMTIETASLSFDTVGGEVRTLDPVRMFGSGITVDLPGLTALINESDRRIAYLGAKGPGSMRYAPTQATLDRAAAKNQRGPATASAGPNPTPIIDLYHAIVTGDLGVAGSGVTLAADQLELWARLFDRKIPDDAIGAISIVSRATNSKPTTTGAGGHGAESQDVAITWTDGFELRPIDEAPAILAEDHLALRFSSPERGNVLAIEESTGALAKCANLEYGLTTRRLRMTGAGDTGVVLAMPEVAETIAGRLELDLSDGVASIVGPGVMRSLEAVPLPGERSTARVSTPAQITWQDGASFVLGIKDGLIDTSSGAPLREAIFNDRVRLVRGEAIASGDSIRAIFEEGAEGPALARAILEGGASLDGGEQGRLMGDRLDLRFDTGASASGRLAPTRVLAEGSVHADHDESTLRSDLAQATLTRRADDSIALEEFNASLGVAVRTPGGVELFADTARVHGPENGRLIELAGQPALVKHKGATLTANAMRVDESLRRLTVFGDGVLNHSKLRTTGLGYERLQVEWLGSMTYDDARGIAEFTGGVTTTAQPDDLTRDIARGERLVLELSPDLAGSIEQVADAVEDAPAIRAARLYSGEMELGNGEMAQLEARRYVEDPASSTGLRLERLLFVEAPRILADGVRNRVDLPDPGKLLVEDRREAVTESTSATAFDLRGSTLFEWDGSAMIDRSDGRAMIKRRVRVRHKDPSGGSISDVECERLDATIPMIRGDDGALEQPDAYTIEASGAVYAQHAGKQLIADMLWFDGDSGMAEASAWPGNTVTLFDPQLPAPMTGSMLSWDTVRDRALWRDAAEITIPN